MAISLDRQLTLGAAKLSLGALPRLGPVPGSGELAPPAGFVFLTDTDGIRLTDADGLDLMEPA